MGNQVILQKLKRLLFAVFMLTAAFTFYIAIDNINIKHMTFRQKILRTTYPVLMWFTKVAKINAGSTSKHMVNPPVSFFTLSVELNDGSVLNFESLKGKKILLVNTASNCGYTNQYDDLQKLAEQYKGKLEVIGFPANDFKEQEKSNDAEIAAFCKRNYGVTFPLVNKSNVIKGPNQHPVFNWLSDSAKNGWNKKAPSWNFSKYLVNERGELTNYFDPGISPLGNEVLKAIR
jgi:glutathione peroxidase